MFVSMRLCAGGVRAFGSVLLRQLSGMMKQDVFAPPTLGYNRKLTMDLTQFASTESLHIIPTAVLSLLVKFSKKSFLTTTFTWERSQLGMF
jgi:hypothetical protein